MKLITASLLASAFLQTAQLAPPALLAQGLQLEPGVRLLNPATDLLGPALAFSRWRSSHFRVFPPIENRITSRMP